MWAVRLCVCHKSYRTRETSEWTPFYFVVLTAYKFCTFPVVFQLLMNIDPQPPPPSLRDHEMSVFVMKACGGGADVPLQPPPVHGGSVFIKLSDFMSQHRGVVRFTVVNIMLAKLLFILH